MSDTKATQQEIERMTRAAMLVLWTDFKEKNKWTFFEYPRIRASNAATASVLDPENSKKREVALVEIARLSETEEILKKVATLFGDVI